MSDGGITIQKNSFQAAGSIFFSIVALGVALWFMSVSSQSQDQTCFLVGCAAAVGSVLSVLFFVSRVGDATPQLRLTADGIVDLRRSPNQLLPWQRIVAIRLVESSRVAVMGVTLRDGYGGKHEVILDLSDLDWSAQRIFQEVGDRAGIS